MCLLNRIKYLILFVFLICLFPLNTNAGFLASINTYVIDSANILSKEVEEYIIEKSTKLENADGTQIVVVTVKELDGMSIAEYANELFNRIDIGDSDKDNGLLLLLALEERKFRVEVGYGLEGILPDGKTGRFQDEYIIPYLKNNDWDNGIKNGYDAFYREIVKLNNLSIEYNEPINTNDNSYIMWYIHSFIFGLVLGTIVKVITKNLKSKIILVLIYVMIWIFLMLNFIGMIEILFSNLIGFILGLFGGINFLMALYSLNRGGSSFDSHSSGGGFSSGGGSSGGGGSSRKF